MLCYNYRLILIANRRLCFPKIQPPENSPLRRPASTWPSGPNGLLPLARSPLPGSQARLAATHRTARPGGRAPACSGWPDGPARRFSKLSPYFHLFSSDNPETEAEFPPLIVAHGPNPRLDRRMASVSWQEGMLENRIRLDLAINLNNALRPQSRLHLSSGRM